MTRKELTKEKSQTTRAINAQFAMINIIKAARDRQIPSESYLKANKGFVCWMYLGDRWDSHMLQAEVRELKRLSQHRKELDEITTFDPEPEKVVELTAVDFPPEQEVPEEKEPSMFELWFTGHLPGQGSFHLSLFDTFLKGANDNRRRLIRAFPEIFKEKDDELNF